MENLIVGGGVMGLSIAYELSRRGANVLVVDRTVVGKESSWAGAGILPPANMETAEHPLDQLHALSYRLHAAWSAALKKETGIDNGYRRCGGIHLAKSVGEAAALSGWRRWLHERNIPVKKLSMEALVDCEPALHPLVEAGKLRSAYRVPDEAQIRNPWHLHALHEACRRRGVRVCENAAVHSFEVRRGRVQSVVTSEGAFAAERVCLTAGAWTGDLLRGLGIQTGVMPIRGQMVMYRFPQPPLTHILNEGSRYVVPRCDGRVLVGSTEEEAGFNKQTTDEGVGELVEFAQSLSPLFVDAPIERTWAGLRPGSLDGFPYLGVAPRFENLYIAAGHFRSGLLLSAGTALVIAQLMCGETPQIDLSPFAISRQLFRRKHPC